MILSRKFSENTHGIFYMVLCCFLVSVMVAIVRHLSDSFHILFILMMRNFFSLVFFVPELFKDYQSLLKTKRIKLHLLRGFNGFFSMFCWFYAISILPLAEAVSISFVIPFTTTLVAIFFLKEKVESKNWLAILIGLLGVVIILRPGFRDLNNGHYFVAGAVILWTISNLTTKMMTKTEKSKTIVAYMAIIMLIISFPFSLPYLKPVNNFADLFWFLALGLISNMAYFSLSFAYRSSNLSMLQPFDYTRLIFTSIIAYFVFGEIVDFWVILGSLVILIGVIIMLPRRKREKLKKILVDE